MNNNTNNTTNTMWVKEIDRKEFFSIMEKIEKLGQAEYRLNKEGQCPLEKALSFKTDVKLLWWEDKGRYTVFNGHAVTAGYILPEGLQACKGLLLTSKPKKQKKEQVENPVPKSNSKKEQSSNTAPQTDPKTDKLEKLLVMLAANTKAQNDLIRSFSARLDKLEQQSNTVPTKKARKEQSKKTAPQRKKEVKETKVV